MSKKIKLSKIDVLVQWAIENGAKIPDSLQVKEQGERGVYTSSAINQGQEICFIPRKCLLSENIAMESEIGKKVSKEINDPEQQPYLYVICMCVFMITERADEKSFWYPFLNSLPCETTLPISLPDEWIQGTNIHELTKQRKQWIQKTVHQLKNLSPLISIESFTWAFTMILSRVFPKTHQDESWITTTEICFFPFLDLLNHDHNSKIEWKMTSDGMSFVALQLFAQDSQVFNNYGPKGNENLLSNYGFALLENPFDYVKLKLSIREQDPRYSQKKQMVDNGLETVFLLFKDDKINTKMIESCKALITSHPSLHDPISLQFKATVILNQLLSQKLGDLNKYDLGQFHNDSSGYTYCWIYRQGQIEIIKHQLEILKASIQGYEFLHQESPLLDPLPINFDPDTDLALSILMLNTSFRKLTDEQKNAIMDVEEYMHYYVEEVEPNLPRAFDVNDIINLICLFEIDSVFIPECLDFGFTTSMALLKPSAE